MSVARMSSTVARRALPRPAEKAAAAGSGPTAQQLLANIGAYIPTDVTTAYVAAAGGIATLEGGLTRRTLLIIAGVVAVLSAFATWVIGHRKARKAAKAQNIPQPGAFTSLRAGWYEIGAAAVAFFAWATAMPGSWLSWGRNVVWGPALMVFIVALVIGGIATLLNRDE
jgi:hypothetical protein